MSEIKPGEKEVVRSTSSQILIELSGAAIFGALSTILSVFTAPYLPRVPGMPIAILDPVSFIWITCFLIFGVRSGLLCSFIGMVTLMLADLANAPWGPLMKFAATISLIIVPILLLKLYKKEEGIRKSQVIKVPKKYIIHGTLGTGLRILVTLVLNIILALTVYAPFIAFVNLEFLGHPEITGLTAVMIGFPLINAWQSVFDLAIPYLIVYGTKIDERFEIW
ncbi:MAG: hypothetical protein JSV62_12330 [Promethearchaeota archaeon]|nr:MAG: hypothetical protein JSV62_12330 [Candidatus Lokiarchaeota archaeon]